MVALIVTTIGKLIKGTYNWIYTVLLHALIEQTFLDNVALVFTFLVHKTMETVGMHPWDVLKCEDAC